MNLWFDPTQQVIIDKGERRKHCAYTFWFAPFRCVMTPFPVKILRLRNGR